MSEPPQEDRRTRIFLLDDHEIVRHGLRDLFESEDDLVVVGESGSAKEAERIIPALRPHVAVLDARLPDGSGIDVCRSIRSRDPSISGIILTSYDDDEALFAAIMAGAAGYVLKQIRSTDLVDAVRRVAAGQSLLDPAVTQRVLERIRNGVEQPRGEVWEIRGEYIAFTRPIVKERVSTGRWLAMYLGLFGSYRKNEQVDVEYTLNGQTKLAADIEITD
jgi:DNA-binding NarL/FixJ family response regulator